MKMKSVCSAVMVAALGMGMMAAQAQDKPAAKPAAKAQDKPKRPDSESSRAMESLAVGIALVKYGDANKDPLALITAARIMNAVGASDSSAKRIAGQPGEAKNKAPAATLEAVLARAKDMAKEQNRQDLIALADDVSKSRGRENGPGRLRTVVRGGAVDQFRVTFRGGEPARILVSGDGDSDLDLYVYDENGRLVCRDTDPGDDAACGWWVPNRQTYTVRVRNLGVANEYVLLTN